MPDKKTFSPLKQRERKVAYAILTVILIYYFIFSAFPTFFGVVLAFLDWTNVTAFPKWNWLGNFYKYFKSSFYRSALFRQMYIGTLCAGTTMLIAFFVALLLNMRIRGRGVFRTIWYIPAVTAGVATTQIFVSIMDPNTGPITGLLRFFGHGPIQWQFSTFWMVVWILIFNLWGSLGPTAVLWLAGLQSIDQQLYEAAAIDGANWWRSLLHVTLPGIRPIAVYALVVGFSGSVTVYEPVMFISRGGPWGTTNVAMYQLVTDAFYDFNLGMAGTNAMILTIVALIFALLNYKIMKGND